MKAKDLDIDYDIKISDLDNMFNVYQDKDKNYIYNLNSNIYIDFDVSSALKFDCKYDMDWPLISYKIYGTTRLAWLLMRINNISMEESFKKILAGQSVLYLDKSDVKDIIDYIN